MPNASTMTMIRLQKPRIFRRRVSNRVLQTASSLLLPLMIAVFTIVTTVIQMNIAKQQREQDLQIAKDNRDKDERIEDSRREKDFEIANLTRILQNQIEENRRLAEDKTQEDQQMNSVLGVYLKEMTELMLLKNFTLADKLIATMVRAKTLTTLGQLDGQRKNYIIRFLYETQMLGRIRSLSIDLTGADLSYVDFTNYRLADVSFENCNLLKTIFRNTYLRGITFSNVQLSAASFEHAELHDNLFDKANLTDASFIFAEIYNSRFDSTIITNADFTGTQSFTNAFIDVAGNNTIFDRGLLHNVRFTDSILINASFVNSNFFMTNMDCVTFTRANFTSVQLSFSSFQRSEMFGSVFDQSNGFSTSFYDTNLTATTWLNAGIQNVDFSFANLSGASITDQQIRQAWRTVDVILPDGSQGFDTNLLENGEAEDSDGNCETNPWHVDSIVTYKYNYSIDYSVKIRGECFFGVEENATQGMMSQRVQVPDQYNEWIQTNMSLIRITGDCFCDKGFTMNVRQFNGNNSLCLLNHTYNDSAGPDTELFFPTHTATNEIELELILKNNDGIWWLSCTQCDNFKLTIWHRNYIL